MSFVPALQQILSGNADNPTRDMANWNSIVNIVNGQLDKTNWTGGIIPASDTVFGTYTAPTAWTLTAYNSDNSTPSSVSFDADDCYYIQIGKIVACWYYFNFSSNPGFNAYLVPPVAPASSGKTAGNNTVLGNGEFQNASPGLGVIAALAQASARINIHLSTATQFGTTPLGGFFIYIAA